MEGPKEFLRLWQVKKLCKLVFPKTSQLVVKCDIITTFPTNVVGIWIFILPLPHIKQTPFLKRIEMKHKKDKMLFKG